MLISLGKNFVIIAKVTRSGGNNGFRMDENLLPGGHRAANIFLANEINGFVLIVFDRGRPSK